MQIIKIIDKAESRTNSILKNTGQPNPEIVREMKKAVCDARARKIKELVNELVKDSANNQVNPEILYDFLRTDDLED